MEINDNSVKGGEYYDNVYDVYLKESGQYNIYIENDLDANKDDEFMKTCISYIKMIAVTMISILKIPLIRLCVIKY